MTCAFRTKIYIGTVSTAITSIIATPCSIGFIIAETVCNQFQWSCTVQICIAYTISAPICVDIRSTTIATIIITFWIVYYIRAETISNLA